MGNEHLLRRTKIIATLGPATDDPHILTQLIINGVNIVRLNCSHGSHGEHKQRIESVRRICKQHQRIVGILLDLQGPKIRIANFRHGKIHLPTGSHFILDAALPENDGDETTVGIDYKTLPKDVKTDDILLLDDGRLRLQVETVEDEKIYCHVLVGGDLSNHKGINRLGGGLSAPALTEKDKQDLKFALEMEVDHIALSFPRDANDIRTARKLIGDETSKTSIIAKIERSEAVVNMDEIIQASDGVMVARGDLAVEIGDAEVPLVQKQIIHRARSLDKPVIIATQMMESMLHSTVPTRAEVSDVANAVLENADAVMLSAETASGKYPIESILAMSRVCLAAEKQPRTHISRHRMESKFQRIDEAIAMATMYTANHLNIKAIIALTESGATPLWMSRIRTAIPIYGLSRYTKTLGKMALYRGVYPIEFDVTQCAYDAVNHQAVQTLQKLDVLNEDDLVILTKGDHLGVGGGANAMKILKVRDVIP